MISVQWCILAERGGIRRSGTAKLRFKRHRHDSDATSQDEYAQFASIFPSDPVTPRARRCKRNQGDLIRYDPITDEFGMVAANGMIRTDYKLVRCKDLPPSVPRKRCHTDGAPVSARVHLGAVSEGTGSVCGFEMSYAAKDNNICRCCGTEFGYDDHNLSYSDLRLEWIENGARWWDDDLSRQPLTWSASIQVISAFGEAAWDYAIASIDSRKLRQSFYVLD